MSTLIWSTPYADVHVSPTIEPGDQYHENDVLKYGELDPLIRSHKMVTLLILPKTQNKELAFHTDDQFDEENLKTLIHFINGKFHHGLGDSAGSEMIQHAFKRGGKIANWDEFLKNLLAGVYGSTSENIDRIADSLD